MMSLSDNFTDAEQQEIIASAMERLNLTREQAERFLDATERPAKRNPLLERQWVRNLYIASEALRLGDAHPPGLFGLAFWIGLYGAEASTAFGDPLSVTIANPLPSSGEDRSSSSG